MSGDAARRSPFEQCIKFLSAEKEHIGKLIEDLRVQAKFQESRALKTDVGGFGAKIVSMSTHQMETSHLERDPVDGHEQNEQCLPLNKLLIERAIWTDTANELQGISTEETNSGKCLESNNGIISEILSPKSDPSNRRSSRRVTVSLEALDTEAKARALETAQRGEDVAPKHEERHNGCAHIIRSIVFNTRFELFFAIAIFTNSLVLGVETDWTARHYDEDTPAVFIVVGFIYSFLFLTELMLRIFAEGLYFFKLSRSTLWNYFDLIIVSFSTFESVLVCVVLVSSGNSAEGPGEVNQARATRLIRAIRLLRFIRIARVTRFVEALRTLVVSILATLKSLFWSMLLLVLFIYTFAIVFTHAASEHINEASDLTVQHEETLELYWSTLPASMLTLFMALTGGVNWETPAFALEEIGAVWILFYLLFVIFNYFAVMNVITAVFVESAVEGKKSDQAMIVQGVIMKKQSYIELVTKLFAAVDRKGTGSVSLTDLEAVFFDEEVQAYFESIEIRTDCAWSLFKLMDQDEGHSIDRDEFIEGCLRLRGSATQLDMASMKANFKQLTSYLHNSFVGLDESLAEISAALFPDCRDVPRERLKEAEAHDEERSSGQNCLPDDRTKHDHISGHIGQGDGTI